MVKICWGEMELVINSRGLFIPGGRKGRFDCSYLTTVPVKYRRVINIFYISCKLYMYNSTKYQSIFGTTSVFSPVKMSQIHPLTYDFVTG